MRKSDIHLSVYLDEQHIPDRIVWDATDKPGDTADATKAFSLYIWDDQERSIMTLPLWTKEMNTDEMKIFQIQILGSMAETLQSATGDNEMASILLSAADECAALLKKQLDAAGKQV